MNLISYLQIFLVYLLLILLTNILNIPTENSDFFTIMLSMASFIFAILVGFAITNRQKRFAEVRHSIRDDDASLLSIYRSSIIFGKRTQNKIKKLLDAYLINQIDYRLVDFHKSTHLLIPVYNFVLQLKPKNATQETIFGKMLDDLRQSFHAQKHIVYWLGDKMLKLEWISIISLYFTILMLLLYLNDQTTLSLFVIPIVGTTLFIPILILKNLNNLTWQNQNWDWKALTKLFNELDLTPYYPYKPSSIPGMLKYLEEENVQIYRVATYPSKYPILDDKIVETIKLK